MGQKLTRLQGTSKLGSATECPMCGELFGKKVTYNEVSLIKQNNQGYSVTLLD